MNWEEAPEKISIGKAIEIAQILGVSLDDITFRKEEA
jgi:hypothetical protein